MQELEGDVSARLFDVPSHGLTPGNSFNSTRGSLINCLPVGLFRGNVTSKTTDSWNNLTCFVAKKTKKTRHILKAIFNSASLQTPYLYFGVLADQRRLGIISACPRHRGPAVYTFSYFCLSCSCAAGCGLCSYVPLTGVTVELVASRVRLRFECLQYLQMFAMRKVNTTRAVRLLKRRTSVIPGASVLCFPLTPVTLVSRHTRRTHCMMLLF